MHNFFCVVVILLLLVIIPASADNTTITATQTTIAEKTPIPTETMVVIKIKEAMDIVIKIISDSGKVSDTKVDTTKDSTILKPTSIQIQSGNWTLSTKKILQQHPNTKISVSSDSNIMIQKSKQGAPIQFEAYYGYQKSKEEPWTHLYKVNFCDAISCQITRGDYANHKIWIETKPLANIEKIVAASYIQEYLELP